MAAAGQTLAEIARALDVSIDTLWRWREKPEFSDALKTAREIATKRVEQSPHHRAIGYEHEATRSCRTARK